MKQNEQDIAVYLRRNHDLFYKIKAYLKNNKKFKVTNESTFVFLVTQFYEQHVKQTETPTDVG